MVAVREFVEEFNKARFFFMTARMFGLPVLALHVYRLEEATFTVRVASLVNMVDQHGDEISRVETVTVLNDLCVFAPGALVDPRLSWHLVGRSARQQQRPVHPDALEHAGRRLS